jgi:hypothetical protein
MSDACPLRQGFFVCVTPYLCTSMLSDELQVSSLKPREGPLSVHPHLHLLLRLSQ